MAKRSIIKEKWVVACMYSYRAKTIAASQPSFRDRASTSAAVQPRPEIVRFDAIAAAAVSRLLCFALSYITVYICEMRVFSFLAK
jgi:hypothetical protein